MNPKVEYDTGVTLLLSGSKEEQLELATSNPAVLRARRDVGEPVIEGLSPGTATVTGSYWGIVSAPMPVEVLPDH